MRTSLPAVLGGLGGGPGCGGRGGTGLGGLGGGPGCGGRGVTGPAVSGGECRG